MKGSHANRKATREEMAYASQVIQEAYPEYEIVWGSHGDYGGHRRHGIIRLHSDYATNGESITQT